MGVSQVHGDDTISHVVSKTFNQIPSCLKKHTCTCIHVHVCIFCSNMLGAAKTAQAYIALQKRNKEVSVF